MTERYSFLSPDSSLRGIPIYQLERAIASTSLRDGKHLSPDDDMDLAASEIENRKIDEFCWSLCFQPEFLIRLFHAGFLPICTNLGADGDPVYCLLPKLHFQRCVVEPHSVRVHKTARRKAARYVMTVDSAFDEVMHACCLQHAGNNWLYPPLRNALQDIHAVPTGPVRVHSVELWDKEGRLVAGEIGYSVGSAYTSMTGFYSESGAGAVQLAALAGLLKQSGAKLWDLGMGMDYKMDMGARLMPRAEWLSAVRQLRNEPRLSFPTSPVPARELIDCLRSIPP